MSSDPTQWIKASASGGNGECVEMRRHGQTVEVRDTKDRDTGPTLGLSAREFATWIESAKSGALDKLSR
jgi:hypothetical protein